MEDHVARRPCPGKNGNTCVEKIPRMTKNAICIGCKLGYAQQLLPELDKRKKAKEVKDAIIRF
jgi:hypothetical protein